MRYIKVFVTVSTASQPCETEAEIEDDATNEEIEEAVRNAALEYVEWWWKEWDVKEDSNHA